MSFWEIAHTLLFGFPTGAEFIDPAYPAFLQTTGGLLLTLIIALVSLAAGALLGAVLAAARELPRMTGLSSNQKRVASYAAGVTALFVRIVQGVPIIVLVMLFYYSPYRWFGIKVPGVILAIGAFTLYAAVYLCEVFRAGLKSVPDGVIDASRILGFSETQTFIHIKVPVAVRVMLPSMVGVGVTVFKDTSVLMAVGVAELAFTSRQIFASSPAHYGVVLLGVVGLYWCVAVAGSVAEATMKTRLSIRGWCQSI